jgi:hypothetical protein
MSPNILTAIKNISDFKTNNMRDYFKEYATPQIKTPRQQLEYYLKDAISGSFKSAKEEKAKDRYSGVFSYLGNKINPPDMILEGGDALVLKTSKTYKASLTLSNSPPKDRLNWNDPWIFRNRRTIGSGQWNSKDIFYVNGWIEKGKIKYLYFVQGRCYASEESVYNKKIADLKKNIENYLAAEGLEVNKTIGLGKASNIDPLGITNLRIKYIWKIQNPLIAFSDIYIYDKKKDFTLIALMLKNKFDSFPENDIDAIMKDKQINVSDVKIKNPNNPEKKIQAKLITISW